RFDRKLRIGIVFEILLESVRESGKRELLAADESDLRMALVGIVRRIKDALERDRWNRLDATDDVNRGVLGGAATADIGRIQRVGLVFVDGARGLALGNFRRVHRLRLHHLATVGIDLVVVERDVISVGGLPGERGGILRDYFFADLAVVRFRRIGSEAGIDFSVYRNSAGARDGSARASCVEGIGGGGVWRDGLAAAGLDLADAVDIGVDGFTSLPVQGCGLATIDIFIRNAEVAGGGRHGDLGAGESGLESRDILELFAALPIDRLLHILGQVHYRFLVGLDFHVTGPNCLALVSDRNVMSAGRQKQVLVPHPVVIHFVNVADEIVRRGSVGENSSAGVTLEQEVAKRTADRATLWIEFHIQWSGLSGLDVDVLGRDLVPVIDDHDRMLASREFYRVASVADCIAIHEDIGLFWGDLDLQLPVLREASRRR